MDGLWELKQANRHLRGRVSIQIKINPKEIAGDSAERLKAL
jgi:hypothetical protein